MTLVRLVGLCLMLCLPMAQASVSVKDDAGNTVTLAKPAQRIISLAPHVTELLYAAGAGNRLVGAVEYSDYPEAAKSLPRVGSYNAVDLERIIALKPDLVVVWQSGTLKGSVQKLRQMGVPVFASEPQTLEDIAQNLRRLGQLAGTDKTASAAAERFLTGLNRLRARYGHSEPVSVFYQVWQQPLMTIGGRHMISQVIELCGGRNIFAGLSALAPRVSLESVLAKNPQVIVGGGVTENNPQWKEYWQQWPQIRAVKNSHVYSVNPDLLQRQTPRILLGAEVLCEQLEQVRNKKAK
ncbi:MAG TPA: cobalamin-binding protein [Gammaproteobacteria bacterium]|nr:cobalamin-binding protein [Gammaproteobacteria bacterium]